MKPILKSPITYYGGKTGMLKYILPLIPEHQLYCEPFFGGGALYFAKEKSKVEVINDINGEVINFFEQLKMRPKVLKRLVDTTLHSRRQYQECYIIYQYPHLFSPIQRARAFWMLTNQGFNNMIGAWSFSTTKSVKGLKKRHADFGQLADRLERTQIECKDALQLIKSRDIRGSFFYIDPPYLAADQGHYKGYAEDDMEALLKVLSGIKGKFLLSNYSSRLLLRYVKRNGWYTKKVKLKAVNKSGRKIEILVANYSLEIEAK